MNLPSPTTVAPPTRPTRHARGPRAVLPEALMVLLAAATNLWALGNQGYGNSFYAAAVRSMSEGWGNWFFAAYDPGGWISVDKPPLPWWLPAALVRVFGYSSWTVLGPAAAAGAAAVALLLVTVRRVWGRSAGLVAGLALATTPTVVAVSRSSNPDVWLVLATVASAFAVERCIATGKARWAVTAGALLGAAFLSKLGAALLVVPALGLAFLLAHPARWWRRLGQAGAVIAAFAVVAAVWVATVAVVPLGSRPWVGGSTDGTAWNLVVGSTAWDGSPVGTPQARAPRAV